MVTGRNDQTLPNSYLSMIDIAEGTKMESCWPLLGDGSKDESIKIEMVILVTFLFLSGFFFFGGVSHDVALSVLGLTL